MRYLDKIFIGLELLSRLDLPESEHQGSICLHLLSSGITSTHYHPKLCFVDLLHGYELKSNNDTYTDKCWLSPRKTMPLASSDNVF